MTRGTMLPRVPPGVRWVAEVPVTPVATVTPRGQPDAGAAAAVDVELHEHPEWRDAMPWLVQGITAGADMSLFGHTPTGTVVPRWLALRERLGCDVVVHAHQVHGGDVLLHDATPPGLLVAGAADGHVTGRNGVLLAVSVADCVPISIVAGRRRAVAALHGGWRGVVAGILERGVAVLREVHDAAADELFVHFGPAICGECFEVGPEVPAALGLDAGEAGRSYVDLRGVLAARAIALGVPAGQVTISTHCTRCGGSPFYSHRAGCAERQVAVMAVRGAWEVNHVRRSV